MTRSFLLLCVSIVAIGVGCKKSSNTGTNNMTAGTPGLGSGGMLATAGMSSAGSGTIGSTGGSLASGGTTASGGSTAGAGATTATGGSAATAGTSAGGAGMQATGGAGSSAGAGASGAGGAAGGSAGSNAGAGGSGDASVTSCLNGITAAGRTVGDCEQCLCQVGNCQDQLMALMNDTAGNALVTCAQAHSCWDQCCICGTSSAGAMCMSDYSDFGMGPCANEVQTAAGVTPMNGTPGAIANGSTVMTKCDPMGTDSNSCSHATKLATCATSKCAAMCPQVKTTCP